ncbi:MAG TPA: NAD(P)/FAD-dependent oxidoreductase, partial [Polyangiaceae bacterium]|nr:NAD(P)/FAD-dependent oxidoreductase [Polyangiaceae bacterium]
RRVVIVGGGFAGINCARELGNVSGVEVTLIDRRNHHLFQPLLYQVAMAGLSPADIAVPIRALLADFRNVFVVQGDVEAITLPEANQPGSVHAARHDYPFDYLVLAAGAQHAYFGHEEWEENAPGLKSLEQATEIRRRVLSAFERAETTEMPDERRAQLTFVVVGGGPTGVELAGAIGEMSRFTLSRNFRSIDPKLTRIMLVEAGPRILPSFSEESAARATRDLEKLGVQVWTSSRVTGISEDGVQVSGETLRAKTVLWAAGVQASPTGGWLPVPRDQAGRVIVEPDLSIPGFPCIFVAGDQASLRTEHMPQGLPGVATVALQQGRFLGQLMKRDAQGKARTPFVYWDKGQMATIGRRRAVLESGGLRLSGLLAWWAWLLVHIYYLSGFRNRIFVLLSWAWSYLTFARGARLIVSKDWRSYPSATKLSAQ